MEWTRRMCWRAVHVSVLLVLVSLPATPQPPPPGSSGSCGDVGGVLYDWVASGQIPKAANCNSFRCYEVENASTFVETINPSCNPSAGSCGVKLHALATNPGVRDMVINDINGLHPGLPTPKVDWYGCLEAGCAAITTCGLSGFGGQIGLDNLDVWAQRGFTCAQAWATSYSVRIRVCTAAACPKNKIINIPAVDIALGLGCPLPPPPEDCKTCGGCVAAGGGGPAGCSAPVSGGLACSPAKSGPGANLRYRAGGAGGTSFPGTTGAFPWRTTLGLYWSHEYAQRIVTDPDLTHVWLITERASFREFSNLAAGTGLRLYQTNAPSDEYRKLYYDTATGGWQLDSLDGRKDYFLPDGRWEKTVLSQNPTEPTIATYNVGNQLESVSFPDGRSETFTYYTSGPSNGKLASITEVPVSGSGTSPRTWEYVWNGDELTGIDRPDGTSWEFTYDPAKNGGRPGYLTQVRLIGTDGLTGRIEAEFEYDSFGNVIKSWKGDSSYTGPNAVNRQEFTYTNPQFPTKADVKEWIDATQSETTSYEFDRDPRSIKARVNKITGDCPVCGTGPNSQFTYADAANPLLSTQIVDGRGLITQYGYNAIGRMTSKLEAVGTGQQRLTTWQYGNASFPGLPTRIEMPSTSGSPALRVTVLSYDGSGNLTTRTIQGAEGGSSFSLDTVTTPNGAGQPLTIDPPGFSTGDQTTYTYDPTRGDLIPLTRTDPVIGATTFDHDGFNRRTSVTDPNSVETTTAYDDLDRVGAITQVGASSPADDLVTTHQYNLFGDLFRTILPRGNLIEYGYDGAGRLISIERKPDGATHGERTFYTLDTFGHRTKEELQHWDGTAWVTDSFTDFVYSSRCHLDKAVNANGEATEYAYDCDGNLSDVWDANHPKATNPISSQHYEYDFLNRLESVTQRWGGAGGGTAVTEYAYDEQDHLETVTDANGNVTTYTWSDRDLMTQEISPVSNTTDSSYNEHGELTSQTDARGVTMIRTVDPLDRVTFVDYPGSDLDTNYTYDDMGVPFSKGRLTSIARPGSTVDYEYDRFGRVTQDGALGFTYDENGNRTEVEYAPTVALCYSYDFADRPSTLKYTSAGGDPCLGSSLVTSASYKPSGPLTSLALGNGLTETRSFDTRYFPDRIQVAGQLDWDYTTDAVGNITSIADGVVPGGSRSFMYQDHQYFLTQGTGPWATLAWTYDKIGNRLAETQTGEPLPFTYSYSGTTPKLTQIQPRPHGSGSGSVTYSYDAAGNQTTMVSSGLEGSGKTTAFTYSPESKLSHLATTPGVAGTDFLYDGRGFLRDALLVYGGSGDFEHTEPTYGSEGLLYSRRWRRQSTFGTPQDDSPAPTITDDQTTHVFYFAGRPMAQWSTADGLTYLTADHLGTPVLATNMAGTTIWQGGFTPFGAPYQLMDPGLFLRLPGQWVDSSWSGYGAEVYYNVHRWYEAGTGRYALPDPLFWSLTDINVFSYVRGNPLSGIDMLGLQTYHCTRPLGKLPGRAAPWVFNHQYACIREADGSYTCDSTSVTTGSPIFGSGVKPGIRLNPLDTFDPRACVQIEPKDPCFEQCVKGYWQQPRQTYAIGPQGEDCQEYTTRIIEQCRNKCDPRPWWQYWR